MGREDYEIGGSEETCSHRSFERRPRFITFADMGRSSAAPLHNRGGILAEVGVYFFSGVGSGRRRAGSDGTAMERAPFLPTERTAK